MNAINFYFRCKMLFSEFSDLPDRSTRKRKNQRVTRSGRGRRKAESSDDSESEDEEVGLHSWEEVQQLLFSFMKGRLCCNGFF